MMRKKISILKLLIIILSLFCLFIPSQAQQKKVIFQHLTTKNGLSQNYIDCIYRDSRGFMWFGTWEGLNYYNGYNFVIYRSDSVSNSISNNFIQTICEDSTGNLWIGTQHGLNYYIYNENRFIRYFHQKNEKNSIADDYINHIFRDSKNNIWISTQTKGIDKLTPNPDGLLIKHYQHEAGNPNSISSNEVRCALEDKEGNIWIGTANGLNKLIVNEDKILTYKNNPKDKNSLTNSTITCLAEDGGNIWIGTKFGLTRLDYKANNLQQYWANPDNNESLSSNAIKDIIRDIDGNIVIATLDGLFRYNREKNVFYKFNHSGTDEYSLNNNFVNSLFCDNEGNVWIGTEKGGVNKYNLYQQKFYNFLYTGDNNQSINRGIVNSIYEDSSYIWIGTAGGGVNQFDKKNGEFQFFTYKQSDIKSITNNYISGITRDSRGSLWFSTWGGGINRLENLNKKQFKYYSYVSTNSDSLNWNLVSSMLEFPKGNMWIGSFLGLSHMDLSTERFEVMNAAKLHNIPIKAVGCLMHDRNSNLWVGTESGLFRLKWNNMANADFNKPDTVIKYTNISNNSHSLVGNFVIAMHEDREGTLWFSVYGFGLEKLSADKIDGTDPHFTHYNKSNGLPNDIIYTIQEDKNGNLWLGTENGLIKFNPKQNSFQSFYESDGTQGNQYYWGSSFKNNAGKMYFGGTKGLTCFWPDSIYPNSLINRVVFTDLKIFNKSVPIMPGSSNELQKNISITDHINLKYAQNMFSLEFAGLNYDQYNLAKYAYFLEGFDNNWIYLDAERHYATYTNLSPGNYKLKVKVANRDGIWSKEEAFIQINILPEWWQTWIFKISVLLIIILILLSIYFRRLYNLKNQKQVLELLVEHRTELLNQQNKEILAQKNEISAQNIKLLEYGNHLEEMVAERTKDLEAAKNKAEEADKLKSSFLANLSHEIRTPLNAIVGFSSLIATSENSTDPKEQWLKIVTKSNETLLQLIDDIIDFARIESGQITLHYQTSNIYQLADEVCHTYQSKIKENIITLSGGVSFKANLSEDLSTLIIKTDPSRLIQILNNLIDNAIKFTSSGFIELGMGKNDAGLLLWVKDTGIGISPENQEIIFQRFRKIEENKDKIYRGTGLGLAIVKNLVQMMGGKTWVESELEKGSTFYVQLPMDKTEHQITNNIIKPEVQKTDLNFSNCKVLVAEDEDANFMFIEVILNKVNATIVRAEDGQEAIEKVVANSPFDLLFMDIKMPVMNGIDATIEIKKQHPKLPIIALTAYVLAEEKENIMKAGFDDYISKPVTEHRILSALSFFLNKRPQA